MEQPLCIVLRMADVIALWQDGTATFILKDGRCYCHVADGMATVYFVMADVIAKWQMEFFRPEEAMFENGKSLSLQRNYLFCS